MWSNTWGDTTQSRNNSSCRCAHTGVIFAPPHHGMPTGGCSLEAIDTTRGYVTQTEVKEEETVGLSQRLVPRLRRLWPVACSPAGSGRIVPVPPSGCALWKHRLFGENAVLRARLWRAHLARTGVTVCHGRQIGEPRADGDRDRRRW